MKVGVIGHVLPLRHPIQTAEEFAQLDVLSGGALSAVSCGACRRSMSPSTLTRSPVRERFAESYEILTKCLTEELFDYQGKFYNLKAVSVWPRPLQQPFPIWMPAGSSETIEFAAERRIPIARVWNPTVVFQDAFEYYKEVARRALWLGGWPGALRRVALHPCGRDERAGHCRVPRGGDVRAASHHLQPPGAGAGGSAGDSDGPLV